jgi:pimeloyl-ACP methyl ester carboxylesterase
MLDALVAPLRYTRSVLLPLLVAALTIGPAGAAFYTPPNPLPAQRDGAVIWVRRFEGGPALRSAAINYLVLYETLAANGTFTAVSGTLAIPPGSPPPGGWPIVSWAHGTTGNAPHCAPSRFAHEDLEQRAMDAFVRRGYAVAQTDYEGNGTPGIHPYMVATPLARDVTDIVRAAREIDPQIGRKWIVMGHSEGGQVALDTAAYGNLWAPELDLVGAVAYAPATHMEGMVQNALLSDTPSGGYAFLGLAIEGFAASDPRLHLQQLLTPQALALVPELQEHCIDDLEANSGWATIVPKEIFARGADVQDLYDDIVADTDPEGFTISTPVMLVQGVSDEYIDSWVTVHVRDALCAKGTPVTFDAYPSATHGTVLLQADRDVAAWTAQRFAGVPLARC